MGIGHVPKILGKIPVKNKVINMVVVYKHLICCCFVLFISKIKHFFPIFSKILLEGMGYVPKILKKISELYFSLRQKMTAEPEDECD